MTQTASWGRRLAALFIDWIACTLIVFAVLGPGGWSDSAWSGLLTMGIFILETTLLTAFAGGSFGKLMTRLRTVRAADGGYVDPLRSLLRAVLICLLVPPLVFRPDGRGLHDMIAGSVSVNLDDFRASRGN